MAIESVSLQWRRSDTLYVGTRFEISYFVALGGAVNTDVQATTSIVPSPRISVGSIFRVNKTTIVGKIVYSALTSSDRPIPTLFVTLYPVPRSDFILQSQYAAKSSSERLNIERKLILV